MLFTRRRIATTLASVAITTGTLAGLSTLASSSPIVIPPHPPAISSASPTGIVAKLVNELPTLDQRVRAPGYVRSCTPLHCDFGKEWSDNTSADLSGNGCKTRDDILFRDMTEVVRDGKCTVTKGNLDDPYTGKRIEWTKDRVNGSSVQIDHIIALSLAWDLGAHAWTDEQRATFANDPENLLAVDGPANAAKGDKPISKWLPPNTSYHCTYIAHYFIVANKYHLPILADDATIARTHCLTPNTL